MAASLRRADEPRCTRLRAPETRTALVAVQQVEEYKYDAKKKPPYAYTYLIYHAIKDMQKEKVRPRMCARCPTPPWR